MDVIEITRQLGQAIQEDPRYIAFSLAKEKNDTDEVLQDLIGEFNLQRMQLNAEISKDDKNDEKVKELNAKMKSTYEIIMQKENMAAYNQAKATLDGLVSQINGIISLCIDGADPTTCTPCTGCGSGCSSCSGCN